MKPIYDVLGVTVGILQSDERDPAEKRDAYAADVTYGTNSEFGFDYLRDNLAIQLEDKVQRGHPFAIVDEVDNILIDEARTPLIISGAPEQAADLYYKFAKLAPMLEPGKKPEGLEAKSKEYVADFDYEPDEKHKTVAVTERGVEKAEKFLGIENMYLAEHGNLVNHLIQSLKAESLYKRDVEYEVIDGEVKIIDEFTGRILEGRRWSEGLHQAVEAKEGVAIQEENQTVATITYQNYFRRYDKLAGMTGTALTEATEFMKIYKLQVVEVPTNQPMVRKDQNDQIYKTKEGKWAAVVNEIDERHEAGQPVLVGTISVEVSEMLSERLKQRGIQHTVLNAKPEHAEREGETVAEAGQPGTVTIATNMAGPRRRHQARRQRRAPDHARAAQARPRARAPTSGTRRGTRSIPRIEKAGRGATASRCSRPAASSSSAPSATSRAGSTTSCAAAQAARATRASRASTSPPRTTSCACSRATGSTASSTGSARSTRRPARRSRSRPRCSRSRSRTPRRRSRSRTS